VRNRVTILAEQLLDGQAEALIRKVIELALAGDSAALKLCLERIIPARRDRPVDVEMPKLTTADDAEKAMGKIAGAVACGVLTPGEAAGMVRVVEAFVRTIEVAAIERRLQVLEERIPARPDL
jgi:hypothetical protein